MKKENSRSRAGGDTHPRILDSPLVPREALDPDALKVVHRLRNFGHQAYLVGGCVRDLLLGRPPKDFDIATSARPGEIKKIFRNSRIIGRRFKLAHLFFGDKILEVSTFRKAPLEVENPEEGDLLIQRDNVFGTAEEDARRRDFTVNGLFYDPAKHAVIDWVGGLDDLKARRIRTIGDPLRRFREDPVRILRAVKFATRLGFEVDPEGWKAMKAAAPDLSRAAPPRILEEIFRLLRSANALGAFQLLRQVGALRVILPTLAEWLDRASPVERDRFWRHLEALDTVLSSVPEEPSNGFLLSALFLEPAESRRLAGEDSLGAIEGLLDPFAQWCRLSRRDRAGVKRLCASQRRFIEKKRRYRVRTFLSQAYFPEALKLFHLRCLALGTGWDVYRKWKERLAEEAGSLSHPGGPGGMDREEEKRSERGERPARPPSPARRGSAKKAGESPAGRGAEVRRDSQPPAGRARPKKNGSPEKDEAPAPSPGGKETGSGGKRAQAGKKGGKSQRRTKEPRRKKRSRMNPRETMCPPEGRCRIPTEEERDIPPAVKVEPEKTRPETPEEEPSWGDW